MRDAVIVSTARTPIGKAYRGAFNMTPTPTLAGHAIAHAVTRAGIDPARIEDVVMGAALQQGTSFMNVARNGAIRAGLPVSVSGQSIDRQCASGMMGIAIAAKHGLATAALQSFVDGILDRMIFDGEQLSDLMAPLELGWKARSHAELALMADLVPLLTRRAGGREISGLSAYEQ